MIKLLLVEDDEVLGFIIKEGMELIGNYDVLWVSNGQKGMEAFESFQPDIIVSDIEMPKMSGLEFVQRIREIDEDVPIILETCVSSSKTILEAYSLGIDNYIKKPFLPDELDAYIQSLLKRIHLKNNTRKTDSNIILLGDIEFNTSQQSLSTSDGIINLSGRESKLLELLYQNINEIVPKDVIAENIWGGEKYFTQQRLDVFIYTIRKYLSSDSSVQIRTMRSLGYMLTIE
ncbi:MAG: response regulator transcription factor [Bacteroidales bacterium]|nr:response regulator transcription factor [Bacteroidales bacterium]